MLSDSVNMKASIALHRVGHLGQARVTARVTAHVTGRVSALSLSIVGTLCALLTSATSACKPSAGKDLSVPELHEVVAREQPTLTPCYQRALDQKAGKQDIRMQAIIHVRKNGQVAKVSVDDEGLPGMKACVEKAIMLWRFPEAAKDTHASLPIIFSPEVKQL
jgi:hypothetical protein